MSRGLKIVDQTNTIKSKALDLGFSGVAIAKAEFMEEEAKRLEQWLNQGLNGSMGYMENHFDKRVDPTLLVPGAKSVISLLYNYYSPKIQDPEDYQFSTYAYGRDYHKVVKIQLKKFFQWIKDEFGNVEGRYFVDSAPILERDWAKRSGLGWTGKNTLLINPKKGSFFFLAELIVDLELEYDNPIRDYCGTCRRCIDACPTDAISQEGYILDSNKCISYLTIELKDDIPTEFHGKMANYIYGCDICQDVCPWNRFSTHHCVPDFSPKKEFVSMNQSDWESLDEQSFERLFNGTAVRRTKYTGLKRNINFVNKTKSSENPN